MAILLFIVAKAQNSYSLINTDGKEIYKNDNCQSIYGLFEGFAVVLAQNPDGIGSQGALVNTTTGKYSISFSAGYREFIPVMDGKTIAIGNESVALLDAKTGRSTIPLSAGYINISQLMGGKYYIAEKANEFCVYDTKGVKLFCKTGKYPKYFNDDIFKYTILELNTEYGHYDKKGLQLTNVAGKDLLAKDHKYSSLDLFSDGLGRVSKEIVEGEYESLDGFIDTTGKLAIPCKYTYAGIFEHGYIIATLGEEKVMINKKEEVLFSGNSLSYNLKNGYVKTYEDEKMGILDATGKVVIKPIYADMGEFENGITWTKDADNNASIINDKGETIFSLGRGLKFNDLKEGHLSYRMDGKMGLMTAEGEELLAPEYDRIEYYLGNHWGVKKGNKYGLYSAKDGWILEIEYDEIYPETSEGKGEDRQGDVSYKLKKGELLGVYYKGKTITPKYSHIGVPNDDVIPVVK